MLWWSGSVADYFKVKILSSRQRTDKCILSTMIMHSLDKPSWQEIQTKPPDFLHGGGGGMRGRLGMKLLNFVFSIQPVLTQGAPSVFIPFWLLYLMSTFCQYNWVWDTILSFTVGLATWSILIVCRSTNRKINLSDLTYDIDGTYVETMHWIGKPTVEKE